MEKIFPLVSTSVKGPLGACHLPRLWLKVLLHASGRLPEGYRHGVGGFDDRTFVNLGIDGDAFVRFVESELPTYPECERWVREHATKIDPESIAKHNDMLLTRERRQERAAPQRWFIGVSDGDMLNVVLLNDLEDWTCIHADLLAKRPASTLS